MQSKSAKILAHSKTLPRLAGVLGAAVRASQRGDAGGSFREKNDGSRRFPVSGAQKFRCTRVWANCRYEVSNAEHGNTGAIARSWSRPQGGIEFAHPAALRWLRTFFPRPARARVLPRRVCRWLAEGLTTASGKASHVARHGRARLLLRQQTPQPRDSIILLLEVIGDRAGERGRRHAKLTPAETAVLHWVAHAKSNREIAEILNVAPATVGKHLEHIYVKLGVENRTAAASCYALAG